MSPLYYLIIGVIGGGLVAAIFFSLWRNSRSQDRIALANERPLEEELRQQLARRETELGQVRSELNKAIQQNGEMTAQIKFLNESLTNERRQIEALQHKFQNEFEAISNKLLLANTSQFTKDSAENLQNLLAPFKEDLKDFRAKLDLTQIETAKHSALLKDEIGRIGTEAANLAKALKGDARVLGNWGENMLDQILEKSGLQVGVHYHRQQAARGEEGDQRFLDVVVDLLENKHLVIDSKVSLRCYEEHFNCNDEGLRAKHLQDHIACIRTHFRGLGAKNYQDIYGINAPDFVLMYIPIEAAFFVAIADEPGLFSEALDRNVVLTTNSTLLATLRTVASVWRLADQQKNAIEIAKRGGQLHDKFVGFIGDLESVGISLKKANDAWETTRKKLYLGPGNLVRQADQLREMGVKSSKTMPPEIKAKAEASSILPAPVVVVNGETKPTDANLEETPPHPLLPQLLSGTEDDGIA